jgi:hypothetical protein
VLSLGVEMKKIYAILASLFFIFNSYNLYAVDLSDKSDIKQVKRTLSDIMLILVNADYEQYEILFPRVYYFNFYDFYDIIREDYFNQFSSIDLDNYNIVHYKVMLG